MTDLETRPVEPMATNLTAENTTPGLKRKASEEGDKSAGKVFSENVVLKKLKPDAPSSDIDDIEVIKVVKTKSNKSEMPKDKKIDTDREMREGTSTSTISRRSASPMKKSKLSAEDQQAARVKKEMKEAEKEAKKAEKEAQRAEKEAQKAEKDAQRDAQKAEKDALKSKRDAEKNAKKQAAQKAIDEQESKKAKQASLLASFLQKKPTGPISRESPAGPSSAPTRSVSPEKESDYRRTFREIPKRANVAWASTNAWTDAQSTSTELSTHDLEEWGTQGSSTVSGWSSKDFLRDHLSRHNIASSSSSRLPPGLKSAPAYKHVSEVWSSYLESDDPRKVVRQLKSKDKFPFKTLAFDQQDRPPYRGTFTKSSAVVGPRTPFAQDPIFDYSYDSAEEWVEEEGGEDVDDPEEGLDEAEEEDGESEAGEFDDWLDDSEDAMFGPEHSEVDMEPQEQSKLPLMVVKKPKLGKKIVKLTPTWDGPLWEGDIGRGNNGFEEYRMQLINDTPSSLDPFTYIGLDPPQAFKTTYGVASMGLNSSVKCLLSAKHIAPPKAASPASNASMNGDSKSTGAAVPVNGTATTSAVKTRPAIPKIVFPALYLPQLVKIVQGSTKSRVDLLLDLKNEFGTVTSKAAIEAKLKEIASRSGVKKDSMWVVKPEFMGEGSTISTFTATAPAIPATATPAVADSSSS